MVRPRSLLPALVAMATLVAPAAAPAALPAAAADAAGTTTATPRTLDSTVTSLGSTARLAEGDSPLALSVGSLAPSVMPRRGVVRVTGTITNVDEVTWSTINLYPFVSSAPLTTRDQLSEATATSDDAFVGDRITDPGPFATIDELEPGESATYTVQVPRRLIPVSAPGVYWFGVHALGESPVTGRDGLADGRARTFLPLIDHTRDTTPVDTAIVVPLRRAVAYEPDGSIADADSWADSLGSGGRLRSLLDFGAAAGDRPVTWLVDPAVSDAAARLAVGNPGRTTGPTLDPDEGEDPDLSDETGSPGATPNPQASPSSTGEEDDEDGSDAEETVDVEDDAGAAAAASWLERLAPALADGEVLALPYGDLDVSAAAAHDRPFYRQARARSAEALRELAPGATPVVTSPGGYLDQGAVRLATDASAVLVNDRMVGPDAPGVVRVDGRPVAVFSTAAETGGPGPDDRLGLVALRQRLLAEAAVRHLGAEEITTATTGPLGPGGPGARVVTTREPEPLVAVLPEQWVPEGSTGFFQGLDVPWVRLATVDQVTDAHAADAPDAELAYPEVVQRRELDAADFGAARALERAGATLQNLLRRNDVVSREVSDEALTNLSYASRNDPSAAVRRADASRTWIETRLRSIQVEAPPSVTLSSASGRFSVTVSNNLDEPVTVGIDAIVDGPVEVDGPATVDLAARSRRTVLLTASTERQGVHNVTLVVTDLDGTALGSSDQLPIRAAQFSVVIWVIIGGGLALFLGAVAVRVVRGLRARRRAAEEADAPDATEDPEDPAPAPDSQETPA